MSIINNAMEVPLVTWRYWAIYEFMRDNPGLYTMDDMRSDCHEQLFKEYKITKEESYEVTGNLNNYVDAVDLHDALIKIKRSKGL